MNGVAERSFDEFREAIASLPMSDSISRGFLEASPFVLGSDGNLSVVYAPFDHVNTEAEVMLVGVTPGWTQMHTSFVEARAGIAEGMDTDSILRRVKRVAAFSGSLRTNLVSMLDGIGIAAALEIGSSSNLFTADGESLLHSTSAVRYPVFKDGKNYTGSTPPITDAPLLVPYLDVLAAETEAVRTAIIVPLGKAVEAVLMHLIRQDEIDRDRCLFGFPHPSGANAHRVTQYDANRTQLSATAAAWFQS